jgi:Transcriptional regulator, AbiEi antitoxin
MLVAMPDLLRELARLGHVARVATLRARGISDRSLRSAVDSGLVVRPRHGWIASPLADRDQLRAIAVGGRIGCSSALRRYGIWSGVDDALHLQVPRTASRLASAAETFEPANAGVWHPSVPPAKRRDRVVRLASDAVVRVHWARELSPRDALDWIVSPQTSLATAARCLDAEHASAAIDSMLHERVLRRHEVEAVVAMLPHRSGTLVDRFTGRPESGVESVFVRRIAGAGYHVEPQIDLAGFGRYDGVINGCVLFEVDGRAFHSGSDSFFADRDRTLVGQVFGVPVVRPSARHVLEDWPITLAAVARTVEDAEIVRHHRRLPSITG